MDGSSQPRSPEKSDCVFTEKSDIEEHSSSRWAMFRSKAVSYNRRLDCLPESPNIPLDHTSGWKMGIRFASGAVLAVILINTVLTLVARFAFPYDGSESTLINGSCSKTKSWGTWLHLLINVLSTVLLSSSSYVMQCLASPTRREIDKAHAHEDYLDVGIPSMRNLTRIDRKRALLWIVLAFSSLPIHLLFNSAVYETLSTNSYVLGVVTEDFVQGKPISENQRTWRIRRESYSFNDLVAESNLPAFNNVTFDELQQMVPRMERLENAQCMRAYSHSLIQDRRNVLAVTSNNTYSKLNISVTQIYYQSVDACPNCQSYVNYTDPTQWVTDFLYGEKQYVKLPKNSGMPLNGDISKAVSLAQNWTINNDPIAYCLSERVDAHCKLHANITILTVVIIFNILKMTVLTLTFWNLPGEILATIGDAAASFLADPEPTTAQCSLLTREDILFHRGPTNYRPKPWSTASFHEHWGSGPSAKRWSTSILFCIAIWITAIAFLASGISHLENATKAISSMPASAQASAIKAMGFGAVNINSLVAISGSSSPSNNFAHVLLVNVPQLVLSLSYFAYNGLWSCMLQAAEWAAFGLRHRPLLVTQPKGIQRSAYFLSIPYTYAVPLQLASGLLHWLVSQSFFLARIDVYQALPTDHIPPGSINTVGYSLFALIFVVTIGGLMLLTLVGFARGRRLRSPIPLVGGCSLAVSAACHTNGEEVDPEEKRLMWGVVGKRVVDVGGVEGEEGMRDGFLHCSLSATEVDSPVKWASEEKEGMEGKTEELFA